MSRFWKIIPSSFRGQAVRVVLTIFIRALLNFIGVAMLVPVLILILDSGNISSNNYLNAIYCALHINSYHTFTVIVCIAAVVVILLKNIAILLLYRFERNFIFSLYKTLSKRLYISYYRRGLGFIKNNNSAILTRNVNVVSLMFVSGILRPIATIIGEVLLFVLIFAAIAYHTPIAAFVAAVIFTPIVLLFYLLIRRKLNNIGERENNAQRKKSRIVSETFRGYADIEINGAFDLMLKRFEQATNEAVKLRQQNATIGMLPQMITEVGLITGMVTIVLLCMSGDSSSMRLLFGVFAIAAIRLIPSIRSIMTNWSAVRYNYYTVDILLDADIDYNENEHTVSCNTRFYLQDKIELQNVYFKFDDATEPTIKDLSLTIHKGEKIGIRGTSGVGKTTLFNIILGLYRPTSGAISIDGEILHEDNIHKWQNTIGYVSQNVFIADMTLAENIALGCDLDNIDYDRVNNVITMADLNDLIPNLDGGINARIGEQGCRLSGGQRQRIGIARALYKNSDILLFDEATSSLDAATEENINNSIRKLTNENRALTIVVIAHRESSLEYCDRVITLK